MHTTESSVRSPAKNFKSARRAAFVASAIVITSLSGCGKSNPLIGQWQLSTGNCISELSFTDKTYSFTGKGYMTSVRTGAATYDFDGDKIIVKADGNSLIFQKLPDDSIKMLANGTECIYTKE